jgi:hypothetical protein
VADRGPGVQLLIELLSETIDVHTHLPQGTVPALGWRMNLAAGCHVDRTVLRKLAEPWIDQGSSVKLRLLLQQIADDHAAGTQGVIRQRLRTLGVPKLRPARRPLFRDARP